MSSASDIEDALETLEEGLGELEDAADEIKGATKELNELLDRVKSAREDPGSMDGESYGQLITDITKFGASRVPLTGPMNLATGAASHAIGSLLGLETAFALSIIRKRFIDLGGTPDMSEEDAEELAGEVSWSSADSDAIFLWWRKQLASAWPPQSGASANRPASMPG